jgi:hypothetical protein
MLMWTSSRNSLARLILVDEDDIDDDGDYYYCYYKITRAPWSIHNAQIGSGAHPAFCTVGTGGSFPGGKAEGSWSWPLRSI